MQHTKVIETPVEKRKVVIKTMLTGAERETVDNAQMQYMKTDNGTDFVITDMKKVTLAQKHELINLSVLSIDEDGTDCLSRLQRMPEPDYQFVYSSILEEQKKMMELISPASS
jgi:hypothetical protein